MDIESEQLIDWNRRGLIPGRNESEEDFLNRVAEASSFHQDFPQKLSSIGLHPDWVEIRYDNHRLLPWHGGCTLIQGGFAPIIQLRAAFEKKGTYLGLYSRDELLSHEMVHAARTAFDEPKFEEFLAYTTSRRWWRRFFGPIISSNREVIVFMATLALPLVLPQWFPYTYLPAGGLFLLGIFRLFRRHRTLKRALAHLPDRPLIYRLTDREIKAAARSLEALVALDDGTLRWQMIRTSYLSND